MQPIILTRREYISKIYVIRKTQKGPDTDLPTKK